MNSEPKTCPDCSQPIPINAPQGLCPQCLMSGAAAPTEAGTLAGTQPGLSAPSVDELARAFPQLEIIGLIGRGGMGFVYRARQPKLERDVALKILPQHLAAQPGFAERFAREGKLLARLNHPSIVSIFDFGESGGYFYLLMEFVDGVNLRQAMRASRFTAAQALSIVPRICEALQFAHDAGVLHRDIKPENILLDTKGRVKIADFGIAKLMERGSASRSATSTEAAFDSAGKPSTGEVAAGHRPALQELTAVSATLGTPQYMAPEQIEHPSDVDHRADIFSLGVVFYELLTGELPGAKLQPPSRKVQIDVRLDEIVLRALETKPELRYQSAGEMRTQVETFTSSPRSSRGNEAPSEGKDQSLLTSAARGQPPRLLKTAQAFLFPPEQLTTAEGQFFAYRTRGQLILDDRQLTFSRAGVNTVIPLTAIRDVSIGQYPRTMSPISCDLLSLTYEEGGQRKQVLLSPMEGWIGLPSSRNAFTAEWCAALRDAVNAATGRAPASTPAETLNLPSGSRLALALRLAGPLFALLVLTGGLVYLAFMRQPPGTPTAFPFNINLLWVAFALPFLFPLVAFGLPWLMHRRTRNGSSSAAPPVAPVSTPVSSAGELKTQVETAAAQPAESAAQTRLLGPTPNPWPHRLFWLIVASFAWLIAAVIAGLLAPALQLRFGHSAGLIAGLVPVLTGVLLFWGFRSTRPSVAPPTPTWNPWPKRIFWLLALLVIVPAVAIVLGLLGPSLLWNMRQPLNPTALEEARAVVAAAKIEAAASNGASGPTVDLVPPVVVHTEPVSGANEVAPGVRELQVRFSKPMTDQSWSWSEAWAGSVPELIGSPHYDAERRTCTVQVKLEPGRTYACWLNSERFTNFKDTGGEPSVPYLLIFETRAASGTP